MSTFPKRLFSTCKPLWAAKNAAPVAKKYLGRPSNNLSAGIVGLANVGKSTFFQAITKSTLGNPANYPFATIDPEEARVIVPSTILDHYAKVYSSEKKVPSFLTIFDIAGLTRGASKGEGLGNKFLSDIRHVDGIYQVVRGFRQEEITHIEGNVDPVRDLSLVLDELLLKDYEFLEGIMDKLQKKKKNCKAMEMKLVQAELALCEKLEELLMDGKKVSVGSWSSEEIDILNQYNFLTAKPTVYLLNVNEADYASQENEFKQEVLSWIEENSPGDNLILFSAGHETKLNEDGLESTVLPKIIHEMRKVLHLMSFYTCGPKEARQWTCREGTLAPAAAGIIHTDLQKTFISAQVIKSEDMLKASGEAELKSQGKIKKGGKTYIMEDGDLVVFKAAGGKAR